MIKLHGFVVSNYVNMVQLALLEKGLPFEFVTTYPNNSEEFLSHSPRGKVPFLQSEHGYINETSVILDYLEESQPGLALLPSDPFARAQVKVLMKEIELYIELPARQCFGEAFFGSTVPEAIKDKSRVELLAGFAALQRHGKFSPYVAGDTFTLADIVFLYSVNPAIIVAQKLFQLDPLENMPGARALLQKLSENPHVRQIAADRERELPGFVAMMQAKR
ncbi:MAG TPA: glutathione S-transferase [Burkholderiaceae bacterium]|jgi:glutathione S-transferase|nr:glutathione S-transferase [Burkholderiaceae bacterium]